MRDERVAQSDAREGAGAIQGVGTNDSDNVNGEKARTALQNRSLHKYLSLLSESLNNAGLDVKHVLSKNAIEIPWNEHLTKELLWREIQKVVTDKESTTKLSTKEMQNIYMILSRHISANYGVNVEWPCEETLMNRGIYK